MSTHFFLNGKPVVINGLNISENLPFCGVIFLVVPFYKILFFKGLFPKEFITFVISFISLFVRFIHERLIDEVPFSIFLPIKTRPSSGKYDSFAIELTNDILPLLSIIIDGKLNINPPHCILDNNDNILIITYVEN